MIFPEVSVSEWIRRHRGLQRQSITCISCKSEVPLVQPYISKDFVGLYTEKCPHCGKTLHARNFFPVSKEAVLRMEKAGLIATYDI